MSVRPDATLLSVGGLHVRRPSGDVLVDGVQFKVARGETIAMVGESGSGKSLTARAVMGLLPPGMSSSGEIQYCGSDLLGAGERTLRRIRGGEIGMVFQDPFTMLNPLMRSGRHIAEVLTDGQGKRLPRHQLQNEIDRRLHEVGITDRRVATRYPFQLSGGMRQRVAIAAALARDPKLLIADEPTTALDVTTQREILLLLRRLQASRGMSLVLITHDLRVAFSMARRVYIFYAGSVVESAPAVDLEAEPLHPYTLGLLLSEPPSDRRVSLLHAISGSVPNPSEVAAECRFSSRCQWVMPQCRAAPPPLAMAGPGRVSACIRIGEIRDELQAERVSAESTVEPPSNNRAQGRALISVRDLTKEFGRPDEHGVAFRALDDVSAKVDEGESVGVVGESGSGKTTLARCLVGLEAPSRGVIEIAGTDASSPDHMTAMERAAVRSTLQIVFQDPYSSLNPSRTIGSALREAIRMNSSSFGAETPESLLELVHLPTTYAKRKPIALSGGERQRVAIARALAVRPKLIICDEPLSALDVSVQAQILNLLKHLRAEIGLNYLFITHDLAVVRQVVDRAYVLLRGRVVEHGPIDQLLDKPEHPYTKQLVASIPAADTDWLATPAVGPKSARA